MYLVKAKTDTLFGGSLSYLWPARCINLIMIISSSFYLIATIASLCKCLAFKASELNIQYVIGNLWSLTLVMLLCVFQILVTAEMDSFFQKV